CVIVKHNNPCGVAIAGEAGDAYESALACDPMSAYGGVIALNRAVDVALADRLHENFVEVLIAPAYDPAALEVLQRKEAIRILEATEQRGYEPRERDLKRVRGGLLVQDPDRITETRESMDVVSEAGPVGLGTASPTAIAMPPEGVEPSSRDLKDRRSTAELRGVP